MLFGENVGYPFFTEETIDCISYLDMLQQFAFPKADGTLKTILLKQDGASRHFNHHIFSCRMKHFSIGGSAGVTQFHGKYISRSKPLNFSVLKAMKCRECFMKLWVPRKYLRRLIQTYFFIIKPTDSLISQIYLAKKWTSTCCGKFLCPSSGVHSLYTWH